MPQDIRVGILSFAHGHVNNYIQQWRERPELGIRVVAGWDHDPARLEKACTTHGSESCASSGALLARKDIDAVVITSETAGHAALVEEAAAAGKIIVLQKPLCLTLAEADRIVAAVAANKVRFTLAWQMRVDPQNRQMKDLVADGRFGRVMILRRKHCLPAHRWKIETMWHFDPALGGDIFADDAAHAIDFVYWMLGMPVSVMAELGTLRNPKIKNDNAIAVFRYADGTFAEVVCSFVAPAGENCAEILCEKGFIALNYGDVPSTETPWPDGAIQLKWFLEGDKQWTVSQLPPIRKHGLRISGLAEPLAEFLHGQRPPIATAEEGRDVLRLVTACYESSSKGKRVQLVTD